MNRRTVLSACRTYRYALWRELDASKPGYALFIGLNPSTADERLDVESLLTRRSRVRIFIVDTEAI